MPALITFGRILFAVLFVYTGASKLVAIPQTAEFIASKVTIPSLLAQLLAIGVGAFEVIAGLMIAINFLARFFAILLILFVILATFYFHDFWSQTPADPKAIIDALKNLSIIGALFIIAGYGKGPRSVEPAYGDV
jgi:uncharacterized membrane protein YphA (DoxX/SURF4 family)